MKNTINFTVIILISILLGACSDTKETTESKSEPFSLEDQLSKAGYVKLTMQKMPSGHLHLLGELNGVSGSFILDTGAGATVIEEKNRDKFKMSTKDADEKATGAGGTNIQMQSSEKNNFTFGKIKFSDLSLLLMNLDHVNDAFESMGLERVDGVLGADILTDYKAIIDYTDMALYLKK